MKSNGISLASPTVLPAAERREAERSEADRSAALASNNLRTSSSRNQAKPDYGRPKAFWLTLSAPATCIETKPLALIGKQP